MANDEEWNDNLEEILAKWRQDPANLEPDYSGSKDMINYGAPPEMCGKFTPEWYEYMHYLYLPVKLGGDTLVALPERLQFLRPVLEGIAVNEGVCGTFPLDMYVYVTARRGYATPGNPINRPGWHADGFGTEDINYIWTDRWPTLFAEQEFEKISEDHVLSAKQFTHQVDPKKVEVYPVNFLLRLNPSVVHAAPEIPAPGGDRSFFKISLSRDKYNLKGNSHNYLLDYKWEMYDRAELRNDPAYAGGDSGPQ